jgi:hypothetical protein
METRGQAEGKWLKGNRRRPATDGDSCLSNFNENLLLNAYNLYL